MPRTSVSAGAQNTWSDSIKIVGSFNLSISGTFAGTVTVQRSEDGTTWRNTDTWTAPAEEVGYDPILNYYRVGIATGEYTSGTAVAYLNGYTPGLTGCNDGNGRALECWINRWFWLYRMVGQDAA